MDVDEGSVLGLQYGACVNRGIVGEVYQESAGEDRRRSLGDRVFKRFGDRSDAFASNSKLAPTRLGMTVEEQWPALKLVGFGFYYAWIWVSYNSNVLVSPTAPYDLPPDSISQTYLVSTLALSIALLVLSVAQGFTRRLMERNGVLLLVSLMAGLATVGTYGSSVLGADGSGLLVLSGALTGIGTSVVVLRFGVVYSKVPAREAVMYTAASFVFACMIYFVAIGLPDPAGMIFTSLLPCMAVLSTLSNSEFASEVGVSSRRPLKSPKGFFVRLLIAVAVFSIVVGVSRGFSVPHSQIADMNNEGALIVFSTGVLAALLFLAVGLMGRQFDVSRLYYPIIIVVAACILVTPLLGGTGFGSQFITVAYNCFVLVIWCFLAYVAYSSQLSAILVFGLGRGASALGTTVGWMAGLALVGGHGEEALSLEVVSVAMVFALLVVSMLVLNDRFIGEALRGDESSLRPEVKASDSSADVASGAESESGLQGVSLGEAVHCPADGESASEEWTAPLVADSAFTEGREAPCDSSEGMVPADQVLDERRPGRYQLRCNAVAERFGLSPRERDVFDLLVRGRSIEYIAQTLAISFNTAKSHIRHIYAKIDVHSRQELLEILDRED